MTTIQHPETPANPFDSIKRTDEGGREFWSARELMPMLGYEKWERFDDAIQRAMAACNNSGHSAPDHFPGSGKVITGGRWGQQTVSDYQLSRYASYLVAMNGDPRKSEIAEAQTYFAVRTREAETAQSAKELTRSDLARMVLAAEEELSVVSAALKSAEPAIAYHDRYVLSDDVVVVKVWAAQFGLTEPAAYTLLKEKGVVYRISLGERWSNSKGKREEVFEYRARAGRESFAWFDLRPQHNAPRHHNGQVRQTLYVRQGFALDLGRTVGLVAA